jgi:phosphatidylglycerol:prolipoprotein diacylglycerol transferase
VYCLLFTVCLLFPGVLRLGLLRVPVFGVFAALGLVLSLWLSQKTAERVGLPAEKLWDAGFFAAVAAFVASRVLLIVADFHAFLRYPLLMLALPSLTWGGLLLTGVATWMYLRLRRLSAVVVADAWAPCACLLAAVLEAGHWVEGTDAGMPTSHWWGRVTPGDAVLGPVWPVQAIAVAVATALGAWCWWRLAKAHREGEVAAWAMIVGGAAAFLLDFVRQPEDVVTSLPLDTGQFAAIAAMIGGACWWMLLGAEARVGELPAPDAVQTPQQAAGRREGFTHDAK